ncbi:MAG: hypothetical protein JSV03_00435 [Planctomycetota bacterium]|nr:MAG: hypothetical protein JSV03_00435 [Planctomycetota bacterium]
MDHVNTYLGIDLGASNGRAYLGRLHEGKLAIQEVHRFKHEAQDIGGTLYWDIFSLWKGIVGSLEICSKRGLKSLSGIGVDSWGVDFGFIGEDNRLTGIPISYRDKRSRGVEKYLGSLICEEELYQLTGNIFSRITTLSQLVSIQREYPQNNLLNCSKYLLMISDLFRYLLGSGSGIELTSAGTTQLVDIRTKQWCIPIVTKFAIPERILPEIIPTGHITGELSGNLRNRTGFEGAPLIAVAGHDTASAVAAIPQLDENTMYISCGSWSMVGKVVDDLVSHPSLVRKKYLHMLGFDELLLVKALMGFYYFERYTGYLKADNKKLTYNTLIDMASGAESFPCIFDMNSQHFFEPEDPQLSVKEFLRQTGQKQVDRPAEILRAVLEGLAFSYRLTLEEIEQITSKKINKICIVGGGARNPPFCQMVADASGVEVLAGPIEATVIGNIAIQALATGQLQSRQDIRECVKASIEQKPYHPDTNELWINHYERYKEIVRHR